MRNTRLTYESIVAVAFVTVVAIAAIFLVGSTVVVLRLAAGW